MLKPLRSVNTLAMSSLTVVMGIRNHKLPLITITASPHPHPNPPLEGEGVDSSPSKGKGERGKGKGERGKGKGERGMGDGVESRHTAAIQKRELSTTAYLRYWLPMIYADATARRYAKFSSAG